MLHPQFLLSAFILLATSLHFPPNFPLPVITFSSHHSLFFQTATQQFGLFKFSNYLYTHIKFRQFLILKPYHPTCTLLLLLAGDIELNPGPSSFTVCTLNIRSLLNPVNSCSVFDLVSYHSPNLVCLSETWIKSNSSLAELSSVTPPGYSLLSFPRPSNMHGGGTGFLVREPFNQISTTPFPIFSSFESSVISLKLSSATLTIFNIYRPPLSSSYSKPFAVFLDEFQTFLSTAATTPHEFLITAILISMLTLLMIPKLHVFSLSSLFV